jgi:hypothetical protein
VRLALSSILRVRTLVGSYVPVPRIGLSSAALSVPEAQYISLRDDATSGLHYSSIGEIPSARQSESGEHPRL